MGSDEMVGCLLRCTPACCTHRALLAESLAGAFRDVSLCCGVLQSYPEYCRLLFDTAPPDFNMAFADWSDAYGKVL